MKVGIARQEHLIVADPTIMLGKPVIAGSRITVELVLEKMASGDMIDDLLEDYPYLTREGVVAALEFAAEAVRAVRIGPLASASP